tara:strand:+ start:1231 stop:1530 length:300 start_codon:yes stop_codon:yes gene_type:complete
MYVLGHPLLAIVGIVDSILFVYSWIVFAVCILSFVNPDPRSPIVKILNQLTQPVFAYLRRFVPSVNGIDLAPIAVFVVIIFIRTGILPIFQQFAQGLVN